MSSIFAFGEKSSFVLRTCVCVYVCANVYIYIYARERRTRLLNYAWQSWLVSGWKLTRGRVVQFFRPAIALIDERAESEGERNCRSNLASIKMRNAPLFIGPDGGENSSNAVVVVAWAYLIALLTYRGSIGVMGVIDNLRFRLRGIQLRAGDTRYYRISDIVVKIGSRFFYG